MMANWGSFTRQWFGWWHLHPLQEGSYGSNNGIRILCALRREAALRPLIRGRWANSNIDVNLSNDIVTSTIAVPFDAANMSHRVALYLWIRSNFVQLHAWGIFRQYYPIIYYIRTTGSRLPRDSDSNNSQRIDHSIMVFNDDRHTDFVDTSRFFIAVCCDVT